MMWDFSGRGRDLQLQPQIHHISRSRSRSPHPPPLRSPSPAFPISFPSSQYSPSPYQYGATLSPSYVPPPSPYSAPYGSRDFPVLSRSISSAPVAPQTPRYVPQNIQPQVVHVVHHRSSNHKLHKKHHSHGHAYTIQNQEYTQGPATPITPSVSYQSAPPTGHHHHSNNMQQRQRKHSHGHGHSPNTSQVRFSTRPEEIPQTSLKPLPRTRVHSQPTLPSAMRPGTSQAYVSAPTHVHRPVAATTTAQYPDPTNPRFQYSTCTGRKKALCVGINYRGQANELRGCINDARNVRDFLIRHGGYNKGDIVLLTDDAEDPRSLPTRANIIDAMRWLVYHAHQNDSLFFHYSGHGGQTKDLDGDEVDGFDEVIYPMDFKSAGHIVDDEMHDVMVKPLPPGCRLTGLFDACHSGTVLDLPYIYSSHGRLKGSHVSDRARRRKATPADVISWSGCRDNQTSADTFKDQVAVGAMSHAFVSSLKNNPRQTYQELLRSIRLILHPRYSQKPQLGSSHHIDTNLQFVF